MDKFLKNTERFTHCEFRKRSFSLDLAVLYVLPPSLPKCIIVKVDEPAKTGLGLVMQCRLHEVLCNCNEHTVKFAISFSVIYAFFFLSLLTLGLG